MHQANLQVSLWANAASGEARVDATVPLLPSLEGGTGNGINHSDTIVGTYAESE